MPMGDVSLEVVGRSGLVFASSILPKVEERDGFYVASYGKTYKLGKDECLVLVRDGKIGHSGQFTRMQVAAIISLKKEGVAALTSYEVTAEDSQGKGVHRVRYMDLKAAMHDAGFCEGFGCCLHPLPDTRRGDETP